MKIAVIGSRTFYDYNLLESELNKYNPTLIVSGGATGADSMGNEYAKKKGLPILIFLSKLG